MFHKHYFSKKTKFVGTHWNHLNEMIPMNTTAIVFIEKSEQYCHFSIEKNKITALMIMRSIMVVTLFICHIFVVQRLSICQRSEKDCDN